MNLILAHAVFVEKRGAEQAVNRSSSKSWNATGKCRKLSLTPPGSSHRAAIRGQAALDSIIHSDGWRGYNGLVGMGYKKHFRMHHGELVICQTEACKVQCCSPTNVPFTHQGM